MLTIKAMVTDTEYRHMPLRTLALHGQRIDKVFASATTWAKLVRQRGWRRPRRRLYPAKPKVGIRAARPNEYWHIDVSVIRLLDGTKAYFSPTTTCEMLTEAAQNLEAPPTVVADSGGENVNSEFDALINTGLLHRVLA